MNRIDETFRRLRREGKKAFIPYITAGDPDIRTSQKIALSLTKQGADIIELGIPFSDPLADGPTIQAAIGRSLANGCTVKKVLNLVARLRQGIETPLVFMTYYNIIFNYGLKRFIKDAKRKGADGIIVPDLPMEESKDLLSIADRENFCVIMLAAPTTPPERFKRLAKSSRGFIYYVSLTGVTGARKQLSTELKKEVRRLKTLTRSAMLSPGLKAGEESIASVSIQDKPQSLDRGIQELTTKPICVGFGISQPSHARDIARIADGVIVGSAIIKIIERNLGNKKVMIRRVGTFARSIAQAVHLGTVPHQTLSL